ncbi:MAG TPA: hypothetical protein VIG69_03420 [Candidatus Methylomirabilis sp.]
MPDGPAGRPARAARFEALPKISLNSARHPHRPRRRPRAGAAWALAGALLCAAPAAAGAQVFLAARPNPPFSLGPLFVRASIGPRPGPVPVDIFWNLVPAPGRKAAPTAQDLYLLWPGAVIGEGQAARPDPDLARYVRTHGYSITGEGRLRLQAVNMNQMGRDQRPEPVGDGAPFVTFIREGGPLGRTAPATYIRIPWTPKLGDPEWLLSLRLSVSDLVRPTKASWMETLVGGQRYFLSLSFHNVRARGLLRLYLEQRDRVVSLSDDPAQLLIAFADADHLTIKDVSPPSSSRQRSESRGGTESVSLPLDRSQGLTTQALTVQFAYLSRVQAWAPVLLPTLFFVLGNLAAVFVRAVADRLRKRLAGRVVFGAAAGGRGDRQTGVILPRDTLARIAPGVTTYQEARQLCGPDAEHVERLSGPNRQTLVYRGRRLVPQRRRRFGWLTTVSYWDVEQHEVEIECEGDVVSDVRAHVRRSRLDRLEPA